MRSLRDLSIRIKLLVLLAGLVSVALVISSGLSVVSNVARIKATMVEHHSVLADVLGANSTAALNFGSGAGAKTVLSSLHLEPAVTFACTYDAAGKVFTGDDGEPATYQAKDRPDFSAPPVGMDGTSFNVDGHLDVFKQIMQDKKVLGTVYLRVSMERLNSQISYQITIAATVLIGALAIALLLGWRLQRLITQPIYHLAQVAQTVTQNDDYTLRAPKQANDELGLLCDGFNAMLTQIQKRDAELERHRLHLEELVQERTASVENKSQELAASNLALQAEITEREEIGLKLRETAVELANSNSELEQFNRLMVGREQRIIDLKREINELAQTLGRPSPYDLSFAESSLEGDGP